MSLIIENLLLSFSSNTRLPFGNAVLESNSKGVWNLFYIPGDTAAQLMNIFPGPNIWTFVCVSVCVCVCVLKKKRFLCMKSKACIQTQTKVALLEDIGTRWGNGFATKKLKYKNYRKKNWKFYKKKKKKKKKKRGRNELRFVLFFFFFACVGKEERGGNELRATSKKKIHMKLMIKERLFFIYYNSIKQLYTQPPPHVFFLFTHYFFCVLKIVVFFFFACGKKGRGRTSWGQRVNTHEINAKITFVFYLLQLLSSNFAHNPPHVFFLFNFTLLFFFLLLCKLFVIIFCTKKRKIQSVFFLFPMGKEQSV